MIRRLLIPLAATLLLFAPPAALARKHVIAPGDPGSSQYQEDIPTAGGSRPVSTLQPTAAAQTIVLPRAAVKQLDRHGATGRGLATFAVETGPPILHAASPPPLAAKSTSGVGTLLVRAVVGGSGGGLGAFLPIVLAAVLAAAIAIAVNRRRS